MKRCSSKKGGQEGIREGNEKYRQLKFILYILQAVKYLMERKNSRLSDKREAKARRESHIGSGLLALFGEAVDPLRGNPLLGEVCSESRFWDS